MKKKIGTFYGLGVGPGDPELITVKAQNILKKVPVVFVPISLEGKDSYAWRIAEGHVDLSRQERRDLLFPMKKDRGELVSYWEKAADQVFEVLNKGSDAAFITEGDPFFYSTFIYLYVRLVGRLPSEKLKVIPGVPSFCASAASAGFPLVEGDARLAVIPSVYSVETAEEILEKFDTVVFMKVNKVLGPLLTKLEKLGLSERFVFVERCGAEGERIVTDVKELKGMEPHYLSLMIVKK